MSKLQRKKQFNNSILGGSSDATKIDSEWTSWDNQSGENVQGFIKNKLEEAITDIEFKNLTIIGKNAFGEEISATKVEIMLPQYNASLNITGFRINGVECTTTVTYAYTEKSKYELGIQLNIGYQTSSWNDIIRASEKVIITIGTNYDTFEIKTVTKDDPDISWIDITELIKKCSSDELASCVITVSANPTYLDNNSNPTEIITGGLIKKTNTYRIVKLEVTCTNKDFILSDNTLNFFVKGVKTNEYLLQYCAKTLEELQSYGNGTSLNFSNQGVAINSSGLVSINFETSGVYSVYVRAIHTTTTSITSDWVLYNIIATKGYSGVPLPVVTDIVSSVQNCNMATLFNFLVFPGNGGNTSIKSYLSNSTTSVWNNEFKSATYNNVQSGDKITLSFTTYNEFHDLPSEGALRFLGLKLTIADKDYIVKNFAYNASNNTIIVRNYFNFTITLPAGNENGLYQYVDDYSLLKHFSQATLQNNDIFEPSNLDPDLSSNEGYTISGNTTSFKVAAHYKNTSSGLFNNPIDLKNLLLSNLGFTFEVEYKTSNTNGEDPVFSLGSLIFGPGYCRLDTNASDKNSLVSFWKNSRASYSKDSSTHIQIVYIPQYMPETYESSTYNLLFKDYKSTVTDKKLAYNLLRIYVNGVINREIRLDDAVKWLSGTKETVNPTFNFLIHPISSDVDFYTIRVYNKAFSVEEVFKNRVSALLNIEEKEKFILRNDILRSDGTISLYKAAKKYNVIVVVLPDGSLPETEREQPLWYGNSKTSGSGEGSYKKRNRTILVNYKEAENKDPNNEYYTKYSGCYTDFEYKAQGSSAKKYMIAHNVQASKGKWQTLQNIDDVKEGKVAKATTKKTVPIPNCKIEAKKMVGKVNTASSMQSHKIGAVKLFNDCWFNALGNKSYTPGNDNTRIAVYEDPFLYFYALVPDPSKIKTVLDLCNIKILENGTLQIKDDEAQFFGFFTWGSGKADKPQFGYGDDTPEYILMEGADNASPGANFNLPWAAFQCWDSNIRFANQNTPIQLDKTVTETDPYTGLLIDNETLRFEKSTDPWDFDYGVEESKENPGIYYIPDKAKESMKYFIEFYNAMYEYDYTDLTPFEGTVFSETLLENDSRDTSLRYVITNDSTVNDIGNRLAKFNVYRYDLNALKFVPAGLHYDSSKKSWEDYNLVLKANNFINTELGKNFQDKSKASSRLLSETNNDNSGIKTYNFRVSETPNEWWEVVSYILPIYLNMYEAAIEKYVDIESLAYHQAFMRIVSGTDNRAKNTYLVIFGKRYTNKYILDGETRAEYKIISEDAYNNSIGYFKLDSEGNENRSTFYLNEPVGGISQLSGDTKLIKSVATETASEQKDKLINLVEIIYEHKTDEGDYKIRFMQDDTDTIFETDNNGQQLKPYYLLEPAFNTNTASYWGDCHSSLFYPFDISFSDIVNSYVEKLITYLVGNHKTLMDSDSKFYQYFFRILDYYPAIAYNHTAEIYYELPELFYSNGDKGSGYDSISGFANNSVPYPLSLSHGSCLESECQFMTDRLKMLGSMTRTAQGLRKNVSISGTDSGGNSYNYSIAMSVKLLDYVSPGIAINQSGGTTYHYMLDHNTNKASNLDYNNHLNYDSLFDLLSTKLCSTLNSFANPGFEYTFKSPLLTSNISNNLLDIDKYKEVTITSGLPCTSSFIPFTNAAKVTIRIEAEGGSSDKNYYNIAGTYYTMSNYYPVVEDLVLNNINFTSGSTTLDFRNCSRLHSIDLTGCTGIKSIIIPDNKNLEKLVIPSSVTVLSLGYLPNLSTENFEGNGFEATDLTIDAGNIVLFHKILKENIAIGARNLIIYNVKNKDIWMPKDILQIISEFNYVNFFGTIFVGESSTCIDGNHQYVSKNGQDIDWILKESLANKFGNIDSNDNSLSVKIKYVTTNVTVAKIGSEINISKDGIPTYNLNLNGNNVSIKNNVLDITYTIISQSALGKATITPSNVNTGYITLNGSPDETEILVKVTVKTLNNSSIVAKTVDNKEFCRILVGFRVPKLGDFAYADGTFSEYYTTSKTLVGLVYYQKPNPDLTYEVRVLSAKASSTDKPLGPAIRGDSSNNSTLWKRTKTLAEAVGYDKDNPDIYVNPAKTFQEKITSATGTVVYADTLKYPEVFPSGEEITNCYLMAANNFVTNLHVAYSNEFLYTKIDLNNYEDIITSLNTKTFGIAPNQYSTLVYAAYLAAYFYKPKCKTGEELHSMYKNGHWYIPASIEVNWLLLNVINGQATQSTNGSEANFWQLADWNPKGTGIFKSAADKMPGINLVTKFDFLGTSPKVATETVGSYPLLYRNANYDEENPAWLTAYYWWGPYLRDENFKVVPCIILNISKND